MSLSANLAFLQPSSYESPLSSPTSSCINQSSSLNTLTSLLVNKLSKLTSQQFAQFISTFLFSLGFSEHLLTDSKLLCLPNLLEELFTSSKIVLPTIFLSLKYMEIYSKCDSRHLNYSVYPVYVTSLIIAAKFLDDNTFTNGTWASITGFYVSEINALELDFLSAINFQLHISETTYTSWLSTLANFALNRNLLPLAFQSLSFYSPLSSSSYSSLASSIPRYTQPQKVTYFSSLLESPELLNQNSPSPPTFHDNLYLYQTQSTRHKTFNSRFQKSNPQSVFLNSLNQDVKKFRPLKRLS